MFKKFFSEQSIEQKKVEDFIGDHKWHSIELLDKYVEFFKNIHEYEISERKELNQSIKYFLTLIAILFSGLIYLISNKDYSEQYRIVVIIVLMLPIGGSIIQVCLANAGNTYSHFSDFEKIIKDFMYFEKNKSGNDCPFYIQKYILSTYIETSRINHKVNEKRRDKLLKAKEYSIAALILIAVSFISPALNQETKHGKLLSGILNFGGATVTDKKNEESNNNSSKENDVKQSNIGTKQNEPKPGVKLQKESYDPVNNEVRSHKSK